METIRTRSLLEVTLLRVLEPYEDGIPIRDVYDLVDGQHRFPYAWYR